MTNLESERIEIHWQRPHWSDPLCYEACAQYTLDQWVWEFLRRNLTYQQEWLRFMTTWRELEVDYGKAPDRDFQAWKKDPRASVKVDDEKGDCRVDQENVLIECWMGERWGFYKFPLDPATDNPVGPEQLTWREQQWPVNVLSEGQQINANHQHAAIEFDLGLPVRDQIQRAQRWLQIKQSSLRRQGKLEMRQRSSLYPDWIAMLRYLDAIFVGQSLAVNASSISLPSDKDLDGLKLQAEAYANGHHLDLHRVLDK